MITSAIDASFAEDKARLTQAEVKDRFDKCVSIVAEMRNDLGWSWTRINDNLSLALRCKLEGTDWTPPSHDSWITDESTGLILPGHLQ